MWRLDQLHTLMARALADGATPQAGMPHRLVWDCYGTCQTPVTREIHARGEAKDNQLWRYSPGSATLIMRVPCRKCEGCLRYKSGLWRQRARSELAAAPRTWFGSFTLSPTEHYLALCRISQRQLKRGVPLSMLDDRDLFRSRAADMGALATRYFKRLRKGGASLRYLLVTEAHKSGLPHLHVLLHEVDPARPMRKAILQDQWPHGFSGLKLVESHACGAAYVTKYIAKSMVTRVRASQGYGHAIRSSSIVRLADVITSHLLEDGNLSNLQLHRYL